MKDHPVRVSAPHKDNVNIYIIKRLGLHMGAHKCNINTDCEQSSQQGFYEIIETRGSNPISGRTRIFQRAWH